MKIIPEQSTSLIQQDSSLSTRLNKVACGFFLLGMFIAAMIFHYLGIFPTS